MLGLRHYFGVGFCIRSYNRIFAANMSNNKPENPLGGTSKGTPGEGAGQGGGGGGIF